MKEITDDDILGLMNVPKTFETGFRLLMKKYQEPLYRHVRRMVSNHDDANDVIQNSFIKVFKNIERFEGKSKLYTWLYRIATNEAITFINSQQRHTTETLDDPNVVSVSNQIKADSYFDGEAVQEKFEQALTLLPAKQRAVFNLRYYNEMPYEEMSEVLNTSVGALKASYHHAVKKIEYFFKNTETDL